MNERFSSITTFDFLSALGAPYGITLEKTSYSFSQQRWFATIHCPRDLKDPCFHISLPNDYGGLVQCDMYYHDHNGILPKVRSFQEEQFGVMYFLFEGNTDPDGVYRVHLLQHVSKDYLPGISTTSMPKRNYAEKWLAILLVCPQRRSLVFESANVKKTIGNRLPMASGTMQAAFA